MSVETQAVSQLDVVQARATEVLGQLKKLSGDMEDGFFTVCDLLREAHEGDYHNVYGFARFSDWVETASGLDMSARQAFYYIQISKKSSQLGLTRDQLKQIKITKLKEILSLEISEHEEAIRALISEAAALTLEQVKERVRELKGQADVLYLTLKLERSIKETLDEALELARRNYGSVVKDGEVADISDSKAVELILVSFLQDPNQHPEDGDEELGDL